LNRHIFLILFYIKIMPQIKEENKKWTEI